MTRRSHIFLSFAGDDTCEASLLQFAFETLLSSTQTKVWSYKRDQVASVRSVASSLKGEIQRSSALIFLASPSTLKGGAAQWMELAYADAFEVPIYVLLHRISYQKLRLKERGAPPFLTEGQCTIAEKWRDVATQIMETTAVGRKLK